VWRGAAQLRRIDTKKGAFRASDHGALKGGELRLGVENPFGTKAFAAEKRGVEGPILQRAHGIIAEQRGLTVEKRSAENVQVQPGRSAQQSRNGQTIRHDAKAGKIATARKQLTGNDLNRRSRIEKNRPFPRRLLGRRGADPSFG